MTHYYQKLNVYQYKVCKEIMKIIQRQYLEKLHNENTDVNLKPY